MSKTSRATPSRPLPVDATDRQLVARAAAHMSWARTVDRTARTAPARHASRAGLDERFERIVDPDGAMSPEDRAKAAASAKSAHYTALARRARNARRKAAQARDDAADLARQAARLDAQAELVDAELESADKDSAA